MVDKILIVGFAVVTSTGSVAASAMYEKVMLDKAIQQFEAAEMTCRGADEASITSPGFKHRPLLG